MSFFSNIFSGKPKDDAYEPVYDFSSIAVDIHSHLIPGIDDGVKDLNESMEMIRGFAKLGYRKLITTPHIMSDHFRNTPQIINEGLRAVREKIKEENIDIVIEAAAEYYFDEVFTARFKSEKLLCIKDKYLLFEISYINPPDNLYHAIFDMRVAGYYPILAHPERYNFWFNKPEEFRKLKEAGALLQLNINSLTGYYGLPSKKIAERLIDERLIDFIGSDMHGARHMEALNNVLKEKYLWKLFSQGLKNKELI